ncbi:MAG: class I SAM-dependent methyltransferase [Deltaproteobacteria bacterium]|nr:class I SAM-dependent methyltransferase [Deltaproteobacteria bacterium]
MGMLDGLRKLWSSGDKGHHELAYWRKRKAAEGTLGNDHYEAFYTSHFGLSHDDYAGKRVLDIGCGPRGSLEWATKARERVGLDPLAAEYRKLGAAEHQMRYVACSAEHIPFADGHFDILCTFNSLDHVDDLEATIAEIGRVVAPGGLCLLLTDVNHDPTPAEPITFSFDVVDSFRPAFEVIETGHHEKRIRGLYESLAEDIPYDHDDPSRRYGILSAKLRRR